MAFILRLCSRSPRRRSPSTTGSELALPQTSSPTMARKAKCDCVITTLTHSLCPCFHSRSHSIAAASPSEHAPPPPRVLLLGPSGAGKTTFLYRVKTGAFFDVKPTVGFVVEEIPVSKRGATITFSEVAGTNRRNIRLQFLQLPPQTGVSVLFFVDVAAPPGVLRAAMEEMRYVLAYARERGCEVYYMGVVLNKQDLLDPVAAARRRGGGGGEGEKEWAGGEKEVEEEDGQGSVVRWVRKEVEAVMDAVGGSLGEVGVVWEVLERSAEGRGVSMRMGDGVKEVMERLMKGMKEGEERVRRKRMGLDQIAAAGKEV